MMEFVDAGRMRHIDKNDRCAVNKAPSRNWARERVLHRSVCAARTRAALLALDGLPPRGGLLGLPGAQKQRHTNGLYCGCAKKAPRLDGLRRWHQAPSGPLSPE